MTNKEIAASIKKAADKIEGYMEDYQNGRWITDVEPEESLFQEINEMLAQIDSLTYYVKEESKPTSSTLPTTVHKSQPKWTGIWPANCDICKTDLTKQEDFIDGTTWMGPWALMCRVCHAGDGVGLGLGKGQLYSSHTLIKLEG